MLKVTVAIPVYNSGKHLKATLDSLSHQTMPSSDFEIICVNDCSTDDSKEVIGSYGKLMSNLILINRAENSGAPSVPRNQAIELASGKYILFMDSDDFLGDEALERFYNAAQKNVSEVIFGKYVGVNGREVPTSMFKKGNRDKADIIADELVYSLAPHKMFKVSFLKENGFKFHPEATAANEDQLFVMQCFVAAKVITVLSDYDYYFVVSRGNENISTKYSPSHQFFFVYYKLMEFLNEYIHDEQYRKNIKVAYLNRFLQVSRLRRYLLTSILTTDQKIGWLNETKRFIEEHLDEELIESLKPRFHNFLKVAKENNIEKLLKVRL